MMTYMSSSFKKCHVHPREIVSATEHTLRRSKNTRMDDKEKSTLIQTSIQERNYP